MSGGGTPIWKQAVLSLLAFVLGLAAGMLVLSLTDLGGAYTFLDAIAPFVAAMLAGVLLGLLPTPIPTWVVAVGYLLPFGLVETLICLLDDGGSIPVGQIAVLLVLPLFTLAGAMVWRFVPQLLGPSQWRGPAKEPRCPQCGYILYHAEDQRCPECGRRFELHEVDMRLARLDGQTLRPRDAGQAGPIRQVQANVATPAPGSIPPEGGTPGSQ